MKITYGIAMSISKDEANRNMQRNKRKQWNVKDYNKAVKKFNQIFRETNNGSINT